MSVSSNTFAKKFASYFILAAVITAYGMLICLASLSFGGLLCGGDHSFSEICPISSGFLSGIIDLSPARQLAWLFLLLVVVHLIARRSILYFRGDRERPPAWYLAFGPARSGERGLAPENLMIARGILHSRIFSEEGIVRR